MKHLSAFITAAAAAAGAFSFIPPEAAAAPPPLLNHQIRNPSVDRCATTIPGEVFTQNTGCVTNNNFQRWSTFLVAGTTYRILNVGSTNDQFFPMCLTLGTTQAGAEPTINPCDGTSSQDWQITPVAGPPDRYRICKSDGVSNYCLQAGSAGTNIRVELQSFTPLQSWRLLP